MTTRPKRIDRSRDNQYHRLPLQERGRDQVVAHPAPPLTMTAHTAPPMFPASILATLACKRTPDFCPEVPPMN